MNKNDRRMIELHKQLTIAIKTRNFPKQLKIQREINTLRYMIEKTTLDKIVLEMSEDDHFEAICHMVRMFVYADLLYGASVDFLGFMRKQGILDIPIARKAKEIGEGGRRITKEIDSFKDDVMSEQFGDMCDKCDIMVKNLIFKEEARLKDKIKAMHNENKKND